MKRICTKVIMAVVLSALAFGPAGAAAKAGVELKLTKLGVSAYGELVVFSAGGVRETLKQAGKVFLAVRAVITPQWTDKVRSVRIDPKDIVLVSDKGASIPMIGFFEKYGLFKVSANYFRAYRGWRWKQGIKPVLYNAVFAVPQGAKAFQFKLGPLLAKISLPAKPAALPDPAGIVTIKVVSARLIKATTATYKVGKLTPKPMTTITNPGGMLLEVKFTLTPKTPNGTMPNHFFWHTNWIGIMDQGGRFLAPVGERFMGKLTRNVSHNLSVGTKGTSVSRATFYFSVPAGFKLFGLVYCGKVAAKGEAK